MGDIVANNFGDFWNNSTKFGEMLDMSKIQFNNDIDCAILISTSHHITIYYRLFTIFTFFMFYGTTDKRKLPINLPHPDRNTKFHLCQASRYCVFLSLFQVLRNCYAKCKILMYKPIICCQQLQLYINTHKNQYHSLLLQFAAC